MDKERIFINYRRDDTGDIAPWFSDSLKELFGENNVFIDNENIRKGEKWVEKLNSALNSCEVLIVLIGKDWLRTYDKHGRRRIDNEEDWVRNEISFALNNRKKLLPIIFGNKESIIPEALPPDISEICDFQSVEFDIRNRKKYHLTQVINAIKNFGVPFLSKISKQEEQRLSHNSLTLDIIFDEESSYFKLTNSIKEVELFFERLLHSITNKKDYEIVINIDKETEYSSKLIELSNINKDLETDKNIFELERHIDFFNKFKRIIIDKIDILLQIESPSFTKNLDDLEVYSKVLEKLISIHEIIYSGVFSSTNRNRKSKKKFVAYTYLLKLDEEFNFKTVDKKFPIQFQIFLSESELENAFERNGGNQNRKGFFLKLNHAVCWNLNSFFDEDYINYHIIPSLVEELYKVKQKNSNLLKLYSTWKRISNYYLGIG